jgi:hypothetical protein
MDAPALAERAINWRRLKWSLFFKFKTPFYRGWPATSSPRHARGLSLSKADESKPLPQAQKILWERLPAAKINSA